MWKQKVIDIDFICSWTSLLIKTFAYRQFLSLIQRQVGKLKRTDHANKYTATVMLIGIPNVGKSALANALHQVGRISAAGIQINITFLVKWVSQRLRNTSGHKISNLFIILSLQFLVL